jgi:hypothetical protein
MAIEIGPGWTIGGGISIVHPPPPPNAGWFGGGYFVTPSSSPGQSSMIARITYATDTATASVRGPLNTPNYDGAAIGNDDYGWFGGGYRGPFPGTTLSTVQRITYATDSATASVRGPLSAGRKGFASTGNTTDGWFAGGTNPSALNHSTVQRITYSTDTATASVRGPLVYATSFGAATTDTTSYGWFGGGYVSGSGRTSIVQRITYATDTDAPSTRGPLSTTRDRIAATGNTTAGWFGGGFQVPPSSGVSSVQRITYATDTATASVRGPLSSDTQFLSATTDYSTYGWFGGGSNPGGVRSTIDRIEYATDTATASVRGPLNGTQYRGMATSGIQ